MPSQKSKVPVNTLEKSDKDSSKEFKGTVSKGIAKETGGRTSTTPGFPKKAQKGPMARRGK